MEPRHQRITEIALSVSCAYGFALAGGYAVQAHGMGSRPSADVDLFTGWDQRDSFDQAVGEVIQALRDSGYEVNVDARGETFARLLVIAEDGDGAVEKVELAADWRAHPPVLLKIGPVLHPDDAVANKMCALFGRALPRDFLDIDAALSSGRYTESRLLELAVNADSGFDRHLFAGAIGSLRGLTDMAFAEYGTAPERIAAMRERFAAWAERLR